MRLEFQGLQQDKADTLSKGTRHTKYSIVGPGEKLQLIWWDMGTLQLLAGTWQAIVMVYSLNETSVAGLERNA
jgi:hypothetical protein